MSEYMKLVNTQKGDFKIKIGYLTENLLARLTKIDKNEKEILLKEASQILSKCNRPDKLGSITGIGIGYVQSGKTMSFTLLTALAIDNGFRIIIYLAGIKNNLLEQTTKRLKKDLLTDGENSKFFRVYQSPTVDDNGTHRISGPLGLKNKPAILITVLKHYKHINELKKIFDSFEVRETLGNEGVLIIDDEADQASLNTYARKNSKSDDWENDEFSSTYSSILDLRASIPNHSYIQYTATPQGPLLINLMDLLSPKFHVVLSPGKTYTGGKTFFKKNSPLILHIPPNEVYHHKLRPLTECPQSLINALQIFLMSVAICVRIESKENYLSMMIHADRERDASKKFLGWVNELLGSWKKRLKLEKSDPSKAELIKEFKNNYKEVVKLIKKPPSFDSVINEVGQVIMGYNIELVISGTKNSLKKSTEIEWSNSEAHILIGAEMLNRGYTIEGLCVSYMPRNSIGKSNADTIQQRCRFFGYKENYIEFCRVFLPKDSVLEYEEYVKHEEIMRTELKSKSLEQFEQLLILGNSLNPTRNNILSVELVKNKLNGWRQMNALQHISENNIYIKNILQKNTFKLFKDYKTPDRNHRYVKLDINFVIKFLKDFKIANMPDSLRKSSTIQYLRYLAEKLNLKYAYIFEMAYGVSGGRERSLIEENGQLKISNIFSGRSTSGKDTYPGDKGIKFEDSLCIQIHKVRLKDNRALWDGKILYTLGIYYPNEFAHSFAGVPKK